MNYTVTCEGTPVGTAFIEPLVGLAHAGFQPLPAYDTIRHHALAAATSLALRGSRFWSAMNGDFAEEFAHSWGGGRLAIVDATGTELGVASVMLVDWTTIRRIIVDARPDMARVEAFLRTIGHDDDDRSRPKSRPAA
jgi:hypothetical protein